MSLEQLEEYMNNTNNAHTIKSLHRHFKVKRSHIRRFFWENEEKFNKTQHGQDLVGNGSWCRFYYSKA